MSNADRERKRRKAEAVSARMREIINAGPLMTQMMDEGKLDLMLIAMGIGEVTPTSSGGDWMGNVESRR